MSLKMANASVNAEAAALNAECNGGKMQGYDGTPPTTADDAVTTQNKLFEFTLPSPMWGTPANGVVTANAITPVVGLYDSTCTWYRVLKSDNTKEWDGATPGEMTLNSTHITVGAAVSVTSWTHTIPKS